MSKRSVRVTTTQYSFDNFSDFNAYANKLENIVKNVKEQGSQLVLLPEYVGLELFSLLHESELTKQLEKLQTYIPQLLKLWQELAKKYQIYLQPGTTIVAVNDEFYCNRAYLISPSGDIAFQDKMHLTSYEIQAKVLKPGERLNVFDTSIGKIGIAICYDSEFPMLVHRLVTSGAEIILVPSCTDTMSGFYRVHLSCRARALENQCYVVQACLVGDTQWAAVDVNVGYAGIFSPIDLRLPSDGVIAKGVLNQTQVITADMDLNYLEKVRNYGFVRNLRDQKQSMEWLNQTQPNKIIL